MAYSESQIQRAMRAASAAGDTEALADLRQRLTEAYQSEVRPVTEDMSGGERFRAGIGQGMVNVGRQIGRLTGQVSGEEAADRRELDADLLSTGTGRAGALVGEIAATAPVGGLAGSAAKAGAARLGTGLAARALAGTAGQAAVQGAAEGALMAEPGSRLAGAAQGAAGGALFSKGADALGAFASRGVRPTRSARKLLKEGVDLTPGQMNPGGTYGQLEEVGQSLPIVGPLISQARAKGVGDWQQMAYSKGAAPGAKASDLGTAYTSFEPAYQQGKGFPVHPRVMRTAGGDTPLASYPMQRGAFETAARDKGVLVDDASRKSVHQWLQNQLSALPNKGKGLTTSDDLMKVRSKIRDEIRSMVQGADPDWSKAQLLRNADQSISEVLASQLPEGVGKALRKVDKQYAQYKILQDATRRAGDQTSGMTPSKLGTAVKAATPGDIYARGGGGPLRQWARAGRDVFDQRNPPTGARLLTVGGLAAAAGAIPTSIAAGLGTVAAATKTGRRALSGRTGVQRKAQALARALRRKTSKIGREMYPAATGAAATQAAFEE
jgi:hypothetical protein